MRSTESTRTGTGNSKTKKKTNKVWWKKIEAPRSGVKVEVQREKVARKKTTTVWWKKFEALRSGVKVEAQGEKVARKKPPKSGGKNLKHQGPV